MVLLRDTKNSLYREKKKALTILEVFLHTIYDKVFLFKKCDKKWSKSSRETQEESSQERFIFSCDSSLVIIHSSCKKCQNILLHFFKSIMFISYISYFSFIFFRDQQYALEEGHYQGWQRNSNFVKFFFIHSNQLFFSRILVSFSSLFRFLCRVS